MFATLAELKQYMSITTPQEDQKLGALLDMSNMFVSDYTNIRAVTTQGTIEVQDYLPLPNNRMIIEEEGISSIDQVFVNGALSDVTGVIMRGYMAVLSREIQGQVKLVCSTQPIEITGLAALKVAVMELVKFYHKQEYKAQIQAGGESINFDKVSYLPAHVKSILDLYRK